MARQHLIGHLENGATVPLPRREGVAIVSAAGGVYA
jgi:hypothetical protein